MEFKEALETFNQLNKKPEVTLFFEQEKQAKYLPRFSAYMLDEMIKVLRSQKSEPFADYIADVVKKLGTKANNENIIKYHEKNGHEIYTTEDLQSYIDNPKNFIDRGKLIEQDRVNIECFKIFLDKHKDANNETYSPEEINLLHSDYNSDFWKNQDRLGIQEAVSFFRARNGIGAKLSNFNF